jgi:WD40 repeat protein
MVVSGSIDGTLRSLNSKTARDSTAPMVHDSNVHFVVVSPDDNRLMSGSNDHTVKIWGSTTGAYIVSLRAIAVLSWLLHIHKTVEYSYLALTTILSGYESLERE